MGSRIIVALDTNDPKVAYRLVKILTPHVYLFKLGLEFITTIVRQLVAVDIDEKTAAANLKILRELFALLSDRIFWDGKFKDIPNTVGGASAVVSDLGVAMFNVHAAAGTEAMKAAVKNKGEAQVLAVTVLTSLAGESKTLYGAEAADKVDMFAKLAIDCGFDGVIASAEEAPRLRREDFMSGKLIVTPGIRPAGSDPADQKRISTPYQAIVRGADFLVVGRPITEAPDPVAAAQAINQEVDGALAA